MVDDSRSFFDNNWRHHDITAIVKDYLCYRLLLDFARLLTIYVFVLWGEKLMNLDSARKFSTMTS